MLNKVRRLAALPSPLTLSVSREREGRVEELIGSPAWKDQAGMGGTVRWVAWRDGARRVVRQSDLGFGGAVLQHWPGPQGVRNEVVEMERVESATEEAERWGLGPQS